MRWEEDIKIFASSNSNRKDFIATYCRYFKTDPSKSEEIVFSEGKIYVRVFENGRDKNIYLTKFAVLKIENEMMEILFWIDAFKKTNTNSITLVIPYFGYAMGDKKDEPRFSIRPFICADEIKSAGVNRFVTIDLHSPQIQGFFKFSLDYLYTHTFTFKAIENLWFKNIFVDSPDASLAKQAKKYANHLKDARSIGHKTGRSLDGKVKIMPIIGKVKDRNVVIADDFTVIFGILAEVTRILNLEGTNRIFFCVFNLLLTPERFANLESSPIEMFISPDTAPNSLAAISNYIYVVSVLTLFAKTVKRIHYHESVSELLNSP